MFLAPGGAEGTEVPVAGVLQHVAPGNFREIGAALHRWGDVRQVSTSTTSVDRSRMTGDG